MKQCSIEGCEKPMRSRGYCTAHYERWRKGKAVAVPLQPQYHGLSLQERFEKWVKIPEGIGCWEWQGSLNNGYGQFRFDDAGPVLAHRAAWLIYKGPIPVNNSKYGTFHVLHHCDNPLCVNPAHLFLGTQKDNIADMWGKSRARPGHVTGEKHGMAKLTEVEVQAIRASTSSVKALATQYQVSTTTIGDILRGKAWGHSTDSASLATYKAAHQRKRLTAEIVRAVRASIAPYTTIAALHGIGLSTVHNIRLRKTWKHLP